MNAILTTISGYNPFFLSNSEGKGGEITEIVFYKDGETIASINWFGTNNNYRRINLPFDVKRATKVNLSRNDAFFVRDQSCDYKIGYALYVFADLLSLVSLGRTQGSNTWYNTQTKEDFECTISGERRKLIKDENSIDGYKYVYVEGTYTEKFSCNYENKNTEEYRICQELSEKMSKDTYVKLDAFQVHNLLQHFNITEK